MQHESVRSGDDGKAVRRKVKQDAKEATREAKYAAKEKTEQGMDKATHELDSISEAIDAAASKLDDENKEGLAQYAYRASKGIAQLAENLQNRSVEDLADEAKRRARSNPGLFLLGSVALGFGLSRFMKASEERVQKAGRSQAYSVTTPHVSTGVPPVSKPLPPRATPEQPQP